MPAPWNTQPHRHRRIRSLVTNSAPRRGSELPRPTRLVLRLQFRADEHIPQLQLTHGPGLSGCSPHDTAEPARPTSPPQPTRPRRRVETTVDRIEAEPDHDRVERRRRSARPRHVTRSWTPKVL